MDATAILGLLTERFGDRVRSAGRIEAVDLLDVASFLRDSPALGMDQLLDIVGIDLLGTGRAHRFEVVYILSSISHRHRFRLKVCLADDSIEVPSLWRLYKSANWLEREAWDLFGIHFKDHPHLARILCHHAFVGHALRKDYPIQRRQRLESPEAIILTDDPEHA